ncbi:TIGR03084 family protein [Amycolatopsis antarctica]|uniref:TIGR03084 family protein n=1 Tax=Amycolatopsis antarctica TaxID=1854586 RepID=A0A263D2A0_9PSEU|nr:TIGR03084 family metal-binding protein [Amycolatopsis antarctica]OZM72329.1 TIGR03084 family protein [Amycolatopsis antarctica]
MADLDAVLADLAGESAEVDGLVSALPGPDWARDTPAEGWTIAHQIAHLAWTDRKSLVAVRTPDEFPAEIEKAVSAGERFVDDGAAELAGTPPAELLRLWRDGRADLSRALAALPSGSRIPWYGPPMSATSMASARIMETWAHGQDVADALGVVRMPTARLWQVARFGVRTRDFAFKLHSLAPPPDEFRVELTTPGGGTWTFGPEDAPQRLTGSALDFCLLVTQRRHRDDTGLRAEGEEVTEWLGIAQAFAGPPGEGRDPAVPA